MEEKGGAGETCERDDGVGGGWKKEKIRERSFLIQNSRGHAKESYN